MIVISAGAEIRARESHVGEAGAVGAAADRNDLRLDAAGCHRLFGGIDQIHARLNFFFHIVVTVCHFCHYGSFAVFAVQKIGRLSEEFLFLFKFFMIVIADDII